jgi:hypothetical protein
MKMKNKASKKFHLKKAKSGDQIPTKERHPNK